MTDSDLSTLEALANAATPGPWRLNDDDEAWMAPAGYRNIVGGVGESAIVIAPDDEGAGSNYDYIVAACNALPQLISEIRRLRDECDRLNNLALDKHEALVGYELHHAEEREAVRRLVLIASDAVDSLTEAGYHATAAKLRDCLREVV